MRNFKNNTGGRLNKHIELNNDNWSIASKRKLNASIRHKMKRIYVSILDSLEKEKSDGSIDDETFRTLRSKILNIANDQIRQVEIELNRSYNIEFLNYHIEFKILPE